MGKAFADVLDNLLEGAASGPAPMPPPGYGFATQPLMFTTAVRKFGEVGSHA